MSATLTRADFDVLRRHCYSFRSTASRAFSAIGEAHGEMIPASDDVIREVGRRGGVLGVIACEHWACDGPPPTPKTFEESVAVICTHIDRILDVTRSDDHVAIGSDLDGYFKPVLHGLEHEGRMKDLEAALVAEYGGARVKRFCSENLLICCAPTGAATAEPGLISGSDH